MAQPVCGDAINDEIHMPKRAPPHREVAPDVIDGRHARKGVDGAKRVLGDAAVEAREIVPIETQLRRDASIRANGGGIDDGYELPVSARFGKQAQRDGRRSLDIDCNCAASGDVTIG